MSDWFRKPESKETDECGNSTDAHPQGEMPKNNWKKKTTHPTSTNPTSDMKGGGNRAQLESSAKPKLRTTSVLFVEYSKGGSLASAIRLTILRLAPMLGFTVKVVENAGTTLAAMLNNKDPWAGQQCGRDNCPPCTQGDDKLEDCKAQNILYESICRECNKENSERKGDMSLADSRDQASIYVGESGRSLYERALEHHKDYTKNKEDSHRTKHWTIAHRDEQKPSFVQKVVKSYKTALERQVGEAVRIMLRGYTLNSVGTFNR